jgi:hypothetical protein
MVARIKSLRIRSITHINTSSFTHRICIWWCNGDMNRREFDCTSRLKSERWLTVKWCGSHIKKNKQKINWKLKFQYEISTTLIYSNLVYILYITYILWFFNWKYLISLGFVEKLTSFCTFTNTTRRTESSSLVGEDVTVLSVTIISSFIFRISFVIRKFYVIYSLLSRYS